MLPQLHDIANYPYHQCSLLINIGMLVSSGFSVYLMTQSLESHNLDKINLMVHLKLLVTLPCIVKPFYPLKTQVSYNSTYWSHNDVLILIASYLVKV